MTQAPTAKAAVAEMLRGAAVLYTGEATPRGCLLASAAATGSPDAAEVRAAIAAVRHEVRDIILRRIETDMANGKMSQSTSPGGLADLAIAVMQGMSVLARDGAERDRLLAVAEAAMQSWSAYDV